MMRKTYLLVITAIVLLAALVASAVLMTGFVAPTNEIEVLALEASEPEFGTGGAPIGPDDRLPDEPGTSSSAEAVSEESSADESAAEESSAAEPSSVPESSESQASSSGESASGEPPAQEPSSQQSSAPASSAPSGPPPADGSYSTEEPSSSQPSSTPSSSSASSSAPSGPPPAVSLPDPSSQTSSSSQASSSSPASSSEPSSSAPSSGDTLRVSLNGAVTEGDAYDILCQIVEAEMGGSYQTEALKAQAVAAYSYIKYENAAGRTPSLPGRTPTQKTQSAVSAVLGQKLTYGGSVAFTPYHASSSGYTNPSSEVWGGSYPYLVRVSSKYDPSSAYKDQQVVMHASTLKGKLESYLNTTLSDDPAAWNIRLTTNDSGYVSTVSLTAADGSSCTLTGRQMRETVLAYGIRSHAFTIEVSGDQVIFTTNGYGHGVGMSQTGANAYAANEGWTYAQILSHYYPGTTLS